MIDPTTPSDTGSPEPPGRGEAGTDPSSEALQVALAAEHAAVFVYAALGAQTSRSAEPTLYARVTRAYVAHRTRRDQLSALLVRAGSEPVAAEAGYALPADLGTARAVTARARALEEGAASTYAFLVASTTGETRAWAVRSLLDAAVRVLDFGGRPARLPGI